MEKYKSNIVNDDDSMVIDDIIKETKGISVRTLLGKYCFLLWDGLGFFGTDTYKLARLRGHKAGWFDKFKSC